MFFVRSLELRLIAALVALAPAVGRAQAAGEPPPPPSTSTAAPAQTPQTPPVPPAEANPASPSGSGTPTETSTQTAAPDVSAPAPSEPSAMQPPPEPSTQLPPEATPTANAAPAVNEGAMIDGHLRQGAFFSGPGSVTFVLHHSIMGAAGGFTTMGIGQNFSLELGNREAMLAGTLIGAGLGFASSAWWQFNHWIGPNAANFGIVHSVLTSMALTGFVDVVSDDKQVLAWTAFVGAETGAWLTALLTNGDLPLNDALLISSGAGWALAYAGMLLAIITTSGTQIGTQGVIDSLLIAPGVGAGILALASVRYKPSAAQILRADMFGAGVGAAVLVLSALVLGGFNQTTPYVLSMIGSAGAIAAVSIFWEEAAERPLEFRSPSRSKRKSEPYRTIWW